ncbi:MAG: hypothetical protein QOF92_1268 [Pseudonocardiales bacterium]|nr:hypothetical protein [Pseudonocardiales bacterium]
MSPLLEVHDLHVEIPVPHGHLHAVRGVSLTVDAGESIGVVGDQLQHGVIAGLQHCCNRGPCWNPLGQDGWVP